MSVFTDFLEEEVVFLVSLPYRVGLWMSYVEDDASTDRDDEREKRALESVMLEISKNTKEAPFVSAVVGESLAYKDLWTDWGAQNQSLLDDVKKAMVLVTQRMADDNIENFKQAILRVAQSVALAHGEFEDIQDESPSFFNNLISKVSDKLSSSSEDPDNISPAEQVALKKLREALQA